MFNANVVVDRMMLSQKMELRNKKVTVFGFYKI